MITTTTSQSQVDRSKGRNYNEVVAFLDGCPAYEYGSKSLERTKALDKHFGNISQRLDTVLIGGTNGKSSAIHFAAKLLKEEGFKVGTSYSTHFLAYNERLSVDFTGISNKHFTEVIDEVICVAESNKIKATAFEIMTIASLLFFESEKVDIAILEVGLGGKHDPTTICNPKIAAVTRIAGDHDEILGEDLDTIAFEMIDIAKPKTIFISAEQSKIRLQKMKTYAEERGITWAMPIRKLASLPYIFEQLYGRMASLGERIAQIYTEDIKGNFSPFLRGNLLATKRGQRGRPTLEAKRQAELNPIKTLKGFWREQFSLLRGRFELLDKEKPTILLDNARNLDAFSNLFLGIRLLHYQRPLRGLAIVLGLPTSVPVTETLKLVRYLLKKVNGQLLFVPLPGDEKSHPAHELAAAATELNMKAKAYGSLEEAFEVAKKAVDERYGVVCVAGSRDMVTTYWRKIREQKKF
jgi:folylpolyglutamate synthase/dihydrofolate synthase